MSRQNRFFVKILIRYGCSTIFLCFLVNYFGVLTYYFEESFSNFNYPYDVDVTRQCYLLRHGKKPEVEPINNQTYSYRHCSERKCKDEHGQSPQSNHLMIIVRSAIHHFERRKAIRKSWGFERQYSDILIRTVFSMGIDEESHNGRPSEVQDLVDIEAREYQDIIQFNFIDNYSNLTIKTLNGMRWCIENCIRSKFYLFVDDDFYVSMKNILAFLRNPTSYSACLEGEKDQLELPPDVKLYAGCVKNSPPRRSQRSKFFISLSEYKYDMYPPYVTGGVILLSREALQDMYCASFYTQHFRFDDIFLAIAAQKVGIEPLHSEQFHYYKATYNGPKSYRYILASHGYEDPDEMMKVWSEVRASGYA